MHLIWVGNPIIIEEKEKITTIVDESKVNLHDLFSQGLGKETALFFDKLLLEAIKPQLEYPFTDHRVYAVAGAVLGFLFVTAFAYFNRGIK
jgi:hypothetical protein